MGKNIKPLIDNLEVGKDTQDENQFGIKQIIGRDDDVLVLSDDTKIGRLDVSLKDTEYLEYAQFIQ